jgi:CRP/FNR family transcriptional regulator
MKPKTFQTDLQFIQKLEHRSKPISCAEGFTLFKQGDAPTGLYILKSGEASLMLETKRGSAVMCVQAEAGSLLGLTGMITNEPYSMTARVRRGSEVGFVPRSDFVNLIETEPWLYPTLLQILAADVRSARHALSGA